MTDKIIISRKEIEDAIDTLYIETFSGEPYIAGIWKIFVLLDKAEVSEPVAWFVDCEPHMIELLNWDEQHLIVTDKNQLGDYIGDEEEPSGYVITPLYTSPPDQSAKIAELESEIAKLTAIIEDMKVVDNVFSK